MSWKAYLKAVEDNPIPNDTVNLEIEFTETVSGKTFQKGYKFQADSLQDLKEMRDFVLSEVAKLNQFDTVRATLASFINKEIK